jgi:hypothetical protein
MSLRKIANVAASDRNSADRQGGRASVLERHSLGGARGADCLSRESEARGRQRSVRC